MRGQQKRKKRGSSESNRTLKRGREVGAGGDEGKGWIKCTSHDSFFNVLSPGSFFPVRDPHYFRIAIDIIYHWPHHDRLHYL